MSTVASDPHASLEGVEDIYPLTPAQAGILFHCLEDRDPRVYVTRVTRVLEGPLHPARWRQAWAEVVRRHPALRTSFAWEGLDQPLQIVWRETVLDWADPGPDADQSPRRPPPPGDPADPAPVRPFDLARPPLLRFRLVRESESRHVFLWEFHHLVLDGWSSLLVWSEVVAAYRALETTLPRTQAPASRTAGVPAGPGPGPDPLAPPGTAPSRRPFREFIAWLQHQDPAAAERFWRGRLIGLESPGRLEAARAIPPAPAAGHGRVDLRLAPDVTAKLAATARRHRLTLNTLVQGAWALLLRRYGLGREVVFGITWSGRPATLPGADTMIGMFINTLPFRVRVEEEVPLADWLRGVQASHLALLEFGNTPLARIQAWSGLPAGQPLFDHLLVFENLAEESPDDGPNGGLRWSAAEISEHSQYPFALLVLPGETLRLVLIHDRTRFDAEWTRACGRHLLRLLEAMAQGLEQPGRACDLLTEPEGHRLRAGWATHRAVLPPATCWLDLFERRVAEGPDAPAVSDLAQTLTYAELDRRAARLAAQLAAAGAAPGSRVAVYSDWSADTIIALLATWKAGAAYVPLDAAYPPEWTRVILADAEPVVVLCPQRLGHRLPSEPRLPRLILDLPAPGGATQPVAPARAATPRDPAYVLYTSGSTGGPKGVVVSHANLLHSTLARQDYYAAPVAAFLLLSSFSFDSSVAGIFWTLADGGRLCIPPEDRCRDVGELASWIGRGEVSHLLCVPTLYRHLLADATQALARVRTVIVAGEACPPELVRRHFAALPGTALFNEYGPTEATVWSTVHRCSPADAAGPVPIGRPIPNTTALVVDDEGRPCPVEVAGELLVGGDGVAEGYWRRPDLTRERFAPPPGLPGRWYRTGDLAAWRRDGVLVFLGRRDDQIKRFGLRIEPGQIADAVRNVPGVAETEVVLLPAEPVTARSPGPVDDGDDALLRRLEQLDAPTAEALLAEVEAQHRTGPSADAARPSAWERREDRFDVTVSARHPDFVRTPRPGQREWLLRQALDEFRDDLRQLDALAVRLVPGADSRLLDEFNDLSRARLSEQDIMEDWQVPLMRRMAEAVAGAERDVLEVGFGRGISATFVQQLGVRSHTIIEVNPEIVVHHFEPWRQRWPHRDIRLLQASWQDVESRLGAFDAVLFHAVPLNPEQFLAHMIEDATFAAHFFPTAARLLRPGGAFTYLTTEIDSLARRHQRALFRHFTSVDLRVVPLDVPPGTRDAWWADSMVVVRAVR